jgi:hypothetical protein
MVMSWVGILIKQTSLFLSHCKPHLKAGISKTRRAFERLRTKTLTLLPQCVEAIAQI